MNLSNKIINETIVDVAVIGGGKGKINKKLF